MSGQIDNPILNSPYEPPDRHFELGDHGPTGVIKDGRRPSESFVPIAGTTKGRRNAGTQQTLELEPVGERQQRNTLINDIRRDVEKWRRDGRYAGVTPITRKLLQHWADPKRENRVIFAQREAAETAIFLTEVAGRQGWTDWRKRLEPENAAHNDGLPRVALKMATGSGKTVVMAMLIAWQTLNKAQSPRDTRFTNRFLVVAPGITIRDRLNVLFPETDGNYYRERDLIPSDLQGGIDSARIVITNYHSFKAGVRKEFTGVSVNTRKILKGHRKEDASQETMQAVVSRVLRGLGSDKQQIMVLNDEAHHCYIDKPLNSGETQTSEQKAANEQARLWFRGLQAVSRYVGIKQVVDLSATPYYLSGSGYTEGHLFPWTVSDFSLMDAIEAGIVKVPRTPVDDDADDPLVVYLDLWKHIGSVPPFRSARSTAIPKDWLPPKELEGALRSLHRSYEKAFTHWQRELRDLGETPPVFIVVCPNTVVSKLVYDWIAGETVVEDDEVVAHKPGNLALLSNVVSGKPLVRPRTILIDSAELESGDGMKADFKKVAAAEIEAFKREYRQRNPGADVDKIDDTSLLREVMNTVGKPDKLGAEVRCVVSVSMLTEGWDANTVTHILGVRAFASQLLCEQVVGRGLRRRSYAVNEETGLFEPEYANVYGIPFQFISSDRPISDPPPPKPAIHIHAVEGRDDLEIRFPKLDGYRVELPDEAIWLDLDGAPTFELQRGTVPGTVRLGGVVGTPEVDAGDPNTYRPQEVAFALAKRVLDANFNTVDDKRPWLFPRIVKLCREWIDNKVVLADGVTLGYLMTITELRVRAAEQIWNAIVRQAGNRRERLVPMVNRFDPQGTTAEVDFISRKRAIAAHKSQVSHVTLDGKDGNTWEQALADLLEDNGYVEAYVKNDHLGLTIPYVHTGRSHSYIPDFVVRLKKRDDQDEARTLIIEVSGSQKSPGPTKQKATTARDSWCVSVNNHGGWGRWGYVEMTDPIQFRTRLTDAINALYDDKPIIGDPELLDLPTSVGA